MEAILNNEQVRPGDETQFMHAVFTSEEEMMNFYLTLNCFVSPGTCLVQRSDSYRLKKLLGTLGRFQYFVDLFGDYHSLGVKQLIEGFGLYMTQTSISNSERKRTAENIGYQMKFLLDIIKESGSAKLLAKIFRLHIENVKYLLEKLEEKEISK